MLIRRVRRMSDFLGAECFAVAVEPADGQSRPAEPDREALARHLNFARNLHIETRVLEGDQIAPALVDFARQNQVTQIYLTRPRRRRWFRLFSRDLVQSIVSLAKDMQVVIVSAREPLPRF